MTLTCISLVCCYGSHARHPALEADLESPDAEERKGWDWDCDEYGSFVSSVSSDVAKTNLTDLV